MTDTPVLVPGEPLRFVFAHGSPAVYLLPPPMSPQRFGLRSDYREYLEATRCDARLYRSPALGWEGMVACAPGEETRLLVALRMAEIAILFCEVLTAAACGCDVAGEMWHLARIAKEGEKV